MAFFCRRELALHSEVRLRVLLADADYYLALQKPRCWQEGLRQMEMAHAAAPRDYAIALGLATFLLEAGQTGRATLLLNENTAQAAAHPNVQQAEYDVTQGIGAALAGNNGDARRFLALALQADPHNRSAKAALALLTG